MAHTIRSFNELKVDLFQAVKRGILRRGVLPLSEAQPKRNTKSKQHTKYSPSLATETQDVMSAESTEVREEKPPPRDREEKKAEEGPEEIIELTERTHEILYSATTVFPFTLVPDTVTLDREKLTIAERFFWRVAEVHSVPVSEILTAKADVGPFFGSLHLVYSFFTENQRSVKWLWRKDALELQRMLHGYIIVHKRKINTIHMPIEDLKVLLLDIGQGVSD